MNNWSIGNKLNLSILISSIAGLVIAFGIFSFYLNNVKVNVYKESSSNMNSIVKQKLSAKEEICISNAVSIANDGKIIEALKSRDREGLISIMQKLSKDFKNNTNFKNIKVHIHDDKGDSFLRSWNPKSFGDNLLKREAVLSVHTNKKAVVGTEIGISNVNLVGVAPIIKDDEFIGSIEFKAGYNSIVKDINRYYHSNLLMLLDKNIVKNSTVLSKLKTIGSYALNQKNYNEDFAEYISTLNLKELEKNTYHVDDKYFVTLSPIIDFSGEKIGYYVIGENSKYIKESVSHAQKIVYIAVVLIVAILIIISLIIALFSRKIIIKPLKELDKAITDINNNSNTSNRVDVQREDEIGTVAKNFNKYLDKIEEGIKKDTKVIEEAIDIVHKAKEGFYTYDIKEVANSVQVEELKQKVNEMLKVTKDNLSLITNALIEYGNARYNYKIDAKSSGNVGSLIKGTNALGTSVSEILSMVDNTGKRLSSNAEELAATSEQLSASSLQQAASLEETAAAIEEITSTITQTDEKTKRMLTISKEMEDTSHQDDELAHKTGKSMEDINQATNDIVDAITIIDQIAFQTNILSLNAAVEAATAGEAGKGFAVVAQEVRNLANRSAEAAKQIKELVDFAQEKTKEGKSTADKMVESFNFLNSKVSEVAHLVNDVSDASHEQRLGMDQINDAINQLDKATQENANASESVSQKAMALSELSSQLVSIVNRTTFDKSRENSVCDVNLVFDTTKLKLDHISFKENNFEKVGNGQNWHVKDHHECDLGKWIEKHSNEVYTKNQDWQDLLKAHENVHKGVQEYIDVDSKDKKDARLYDIAKNIEDNTSNVFKYIDKVKEHKCNEMRLKRGRDVVGKETKDPKVYHEKISKYKKDESLHDRVSKNGTVTLKEEKNDDEQWESF
ncbi:methyl-accepting chemotaxis protein [Halarcobacter anaerophilus]|uniref:Chemotaxis protein n=1 Tax=Halarcobacter anaerophilus TaxID=877500 RepID=A0A4Q0XVE8_9BACT|nr:methyl-accepting chemotaxis protein [Halarcobacter anaerophilus]QDF28237.1 Cache sensor-containing MCP-domain signal transduction protein (chemoreceptor zinc-binding domain) [Halarcobacter anaerophilus]RXJ61392.1 chemotaxis protein [Halarcobacter anaerophilus]